MSTSKLHAETLGSPTNPEPAADKPDEVELEGSDADCDATLSPLILTPTPSDMPPSPTPGDACGGAVRKVVRGGKAGGDFSIDSVVERPLISVELPVEDGEGDGRGGSKGSDFTVFSMPMSFNLLNFDLLQAPPSFTSCTVSELLPWSLVHGNTGRGGNGGGNGGSCRDVVVLGVPLSTELLVLIKLLLLPADVPKSSCDNCKSTVAVVLTPQLEVGCTRVIIGRHRTFLNTKHARP